MPIFIGIRHRFVLLWYYAIAGLFFDLLILLLKRVLHLNYSWAGNAFVLTEFVLITAYYSPHFFRRNKALWVLPAIPALYFVTTTWLNGIGKFNAIGASVFCFFFILYGIVGLYKMLQEQRVLFLERSSFFWVNVAFIIYASGNFLLFLFMDYLSQYNDRMLVVLWAASFLMLNIIKNILLGIALSKKAQH